MIGRRRPEISVSNTQIMGSSFQITAGQLSSGTRLTLIYPIWSWFSEPLRRCEGVTARGTRCKFRAAWAVRVQEGSTIISDHCACKIHSSAKARRLWW